MNKQGKLIPMKRQTFKRRSALESLAVDTVVPTNPFSAIRAKHDFTVQGFADLCQVSKQAIIRLEQGTFNEPLPSVVDYCTNVLGVNWSDLVGDYETFQHLQRARYPRLFGAIPYDWVADVHPMRWLRGNAPVTPLTPTEVAKALCFSQATLVHWERHPKLQQSVPKQFCEILNEIGYSAEEVRRVQSAYKGYRIYISNVHKFEAI